MWQSVAPGADFSGYTISIGDLPGGQLGWTDGRATTIDATAAGFGWWTGTTSGGATAQMDLLTVVLHELGRVLGLTDRRRAQFPVMAGALEPGQRLASHAWRHRSCARQQPPVATSRQIGAPQRGAHSFVALAVDPCVEAISIKSHANLRHAGRKN